MSMHKKKYILAALGLTLLCAITAVIILHSKSVKKSGEEQPTENVGEDIGLSDSDEEKQQEPSVLDHSESSVQTEDSEQIENSEKEENSGQTEDSEQKENQEKIENSEDSEDDGVIELPFVPIS